VTLETLAYTTATTRLFILAALAAGGLAGVVALGLRFARRGEARFWLAPAYLALALVPLACGSGLTARAVRRTGEDLARFGGGEQAARAGVAEAVLPLLAGALATLGLAGFVLLLLVLGRRRDEAPAPPEARDVVRPTAAGLLGLLSLVLALGVFVAARALVAKAPYAVGLAGALSWSAAGFALVLLVAAFPLALAAPRGPAPRASRLLALALPVVVATGSLAAAGVAVAFVRSGLDALAPPPIPPAALESNAPVPPTPPPPSDPPRAAEREAPIARPAKRTRVGIDVGEPRKLVHVPPTYPPEALRARVQGTVILECTIGPDGRVTGVEVKRGAPLLDGAAREAVRQWVYEPTRLNGVPVPVVMTVTVNFELR
jgi:TonB family protein